MEKKTFYFILIFYMLAYFLKMTKQINKKYGESLIISCSSSIKNRLSL